LESRAVRVRRPAAYDQGFDERRIRVAFAALAALFVKHEGISIRTGAAQRHKSGLRVPARAIGVA
jgi:hypothetical protein